MDNKVNIPPVKDNNILESLGGSHFLSLHNRVPLLRNSSALLSTRQLLKLKHPLLDSFLLWVPVSLCTEAVIWSVTKALEDPANSPPATGAAPPPKSAAFLGVAELRTSEAIAQCLRG